MPGLVSYSSIFSWHTLYSLEGLKFALGRQGTGVTELC